MQPDRPEPSATSAMIPTAEVAQILGVAPSSARRWAANGRLPGAVRLGRSWLIPRWIVAAIVRGDGLPAEVGATAR